MSTIVGFANGQPIRLRETPKAAAPVEPARKLATGTVEPDGRLVLRFARFDVIDADGDVTLRGAFGTRAVPLSSWNHGSWEKGSGALPIGVGTISEEGEFAVFRGRILLETQAGRESHAVLKALGPLVQVSYGYNVTESEPGFRDGVRVRILKRLEVYEVSAVLRAVGVGTGLVELSSVDPFQIMMAAAAHDNAEKLREMTGWRKRAALGDPTIAVLIAEARRLGVNVPSTRTIGRKSG